MTGSTSTGDHGTFPLTSLNPIAPAFLPHYQYPSDPPISQCNPTTMSLPLAQFFCIMPPAIIPSHAPPVTQPITEGTFFLLFIQPKNSSKQNAEVHQPLPGSSSFLSSPLEHQVQCLQAIHKTLQQFNQHLKAEQVDRKTLQNIVLQLQHNFSLLRYLLFSSVGTIPIGETSVKNSATSPPTNPNSNSNPNPTSTALLLFCAAETSVRPSTPVGAVGPARAESNNAANANFQSSTNKQETPPITAQNLTWRTSKLEKLFADEMALYRSITAEIRSQYFFLFDKIRQLEVGNSDAIIWKIPSVKFFLLRKVAQPSSDPLIEPATGFSSPIFRTLPHGYNISSKSTVMVLDPLLASVLQSYSPSSLVIATICSNGPSRS